MYHPFVYALHAEVTHRWRKRRREDYGHQQSSEGISEEQPKSEVCIYTFWNICQHLSNANNSEDGYMKTSCTHQCDGHYDNLVTSHLKKDMRGYSHHSDLFFSKPACSVFGHFAFCDIQDSTRRRSKELELNGFTELLDEGDARDGIPNPKLPDLIELFDLAHRLKIPNLINLIISRISDEYTFKYPLNLEPFKMVWKVTKRGDKFRRFMLALLDMYVAECCGDDSWKLEGCGVSEFPQEFFDEFGRHILTDRGGLPASIQLKISTTPPDTGDAAA